LFTPLSFQSILGNCRDLVDELTKARAQRLSNEANGLSQNHFFILNLLTFLILLGYIISVLPTIDEIGQPTYETSLLFGILTTIYVVFSFFADDLNEPYSGVYQIRRSSSAVHFLQIKWAIANHPWLKDEVDFEGMREGKEVVNLRTPNPSDMYFYQEKMILDQAFGRGESLEE
jgi:hypothetical protein